MTTHATDARLDEIAQKIAALTAMADPSNGATVGEVENATALIQKLTTKYNLDEEQVARRTRDNKQQQANTNPIVTQFCPNHSDRRFEWSENLAHNIARGFFCKVLYNRIGYYFIGTQTDVRIAIQTFNRLHLVIASMASIATVAYADHWRDMGVMDVRQLKGEHSLKSYKLSYSNGVVSGIGTKLQEQRAQDDAEANKQVTALVVVRDAAIDQAISAKWPKLSKGRASDARHNDEAYSKGRVDGYNVTIARGELEG